MLDLEATTRQWFSLISKIGAVGGFLAYVKSKQFAFSTHQRCCWYIEYFFPVRFAANCEEVFQRACEVKRLFSKQFFISGEGNLPKYGLFRLTSNSLFIYHLAKLPNLRKEDYFLKEILFLLFFKFLLHINSKKNKKQRLKKKKVVYSVLNIKM